MAAVDIIGSSAKTFGKYVRPNDQISPREFAHRSIHEERGVIYKHFKSKKKLF